MIWYRANNQPVTTETHVRLVAADGAEGYARVERGLGINLSRCVVRLDRHYNPDGSESQDPTVTVLDLDPTYA